MPLLKMALLNRSKPCRYKVKPQEFNYGSEVNTLLAPLSSDQFAPAS
jgi:hypothetical protein